MMVSPWIRRGGRELPKQTSGRIGQTIGAKNWHWLKKRGRATSSFIDRDFKNNVAEARKLILSRALKFGESENAEENFAPNTFISSSAAEKIVGAEKDLFLKARKKIEKKGKLKPLSIKCNIRVGGQKNVRSIVGANVLGYIEGTDEDLKQELVIVTAHFDHLGKRGEDIYNGADDNGSGTSSLLEVSEAFAQARAAGDGPRRSVLMLLVSGEEKGAVGV